jgi:hypothetical protein
MEETLAADSRGKVGLKLGGFSKEEHPLTIKNWYVAYVTQGLGLGSEL